MAHTFDGYPGPGGVAWRTWSLGDRVVVRFRDGDHARDALGDLVASGEDGLTVETGRGRVVVPVAAILSGHRVPPRPARGGGPSGPRPAGRPDALTSRLGQPQVTRLCGE
ncbi:hypothetical protein ACPYO6_15330 [Georgenia sp. Z1344]|uniref:hypothetical protein n=1 Tax=Georgenia sp. Z1344 TaxID=3416706 RepID=UPI003CF1F3F9